MDDSEARRAAGPDFLAGGGESGALARGLDWSKTPLGPTESWPQSLRTAMSIVLGSPHALQLFWGPSHVILYNDATRPMMGDKHPATFGAPAFEHWPEVWNLVGPMLGNVLATGKATLTTNALMPNFRRGFLEEMYFTWSFSPIHVEAGGVGGVFQVISETTQEVLGERRQQVLRALEALPTDAKDAEEVCVAAAAQMRASDIPFALTYLLDSNAGRARLVAVSGIEAGLPQSPAVVDMSAPASASAWPFEEVQRSARAQIVPALAARFGTQTARGWSVPPHEAIVLPLAGPRDNEQHGFLVVGLSAGLFLDAGYRGFLDLVAAQIATAVAKVRTSEAAKETARLAAALHEIESVRREDLRLLFREAPVGMALLRGPDHVCEFANDAYLEFTGHREVVGLSAREAFPEAAADSFHERLERVYRTGESLTAEGVPAFARPEECFVTSSFAPFRSSSGAERGVMVVLTDITETVQTRRQLEALAERLRLADRRKDEFLAMLGHELRNPLAPILTAVELMKLRGVKDSERERDVIERQAESLARLVGDLLDVSRIAQGKIELERTVVELSSIADIALEMASPMLEKRRQQVVVDIPREGLLVDVDVGRLVQVVSNLLTNASKFSPPEGQVRVSAERDASDVVLRVTDDGVGIEAALLPTVFELFVQGPRSLGRAEGGLGLGLALVKNLLLLHAGTVTAKSAGKGKGTEFVVTLPGSTRTAALPSEPALPRIARPKRVLLVDDNKDAADLLADLLRQEGHLVAVAFDGAEALKTLADFSVEVGVLDIGLPVMNGYELARNLRELPATEECHLIALTGYGQEKDRALGVAAGFDAFLTKPVALQELLGEISKGRTRPVAGAPE